MKIKVELDLSNNATKYDIKIATKLDSSKSAKNVLLTRLKSDIEISDIDELEKVIRGLNSLKN